MNAKLVLFLLAVVQLSLHGQNQIGDVKYSILPPDAFSKLHKGEWILLDGKDLPEKSSLSSFLKDEQLSILNKGEKATFKMPDARGVFIRGMNEGRSSWGDVELNRKVGSLQTDAFQGHFHSMDANGGVGLDDSTQGKGDKGGSARTGYNKRKLREVRDPIDGEHGKVRVSNETRPRNITLYTYIKIS